MPHIRLSAIAVLGALAAAAPAAAEPGGFATLDAALTLAEVGLADGRPDLILSSVEVVADLAPQGAAVWIGAMLAEARLLALGDPGLLERASSITIGPEESGLLLVPLSAGETNVTLPAQTHLGLIRVPWGWVVNPLSSEHAECGFVDRRLTDCSADQIAGVVSISAASGPGLGFLTLELRSDQAEAD
ncbi:MAG: hypothetical protein AAGA05_10380 [Pseudomonadota bacterium]